MGQGRSHEPAPALDRAEVDRFARLASQWWDPEGQFRALHRIGPARLAYLRDAMIAHFGRRAGGLRPLEGLSVLDIGCGGGLICEPLTRMGARVTGLDPAAETIAAATRHAAGGGLDIEYHAGEAQDLIAEGRTFDAVVCLEVIEHVPDPAAFLRRAGALVSGGGLVLLSTINRTFKAYLLAIVAGEYILRWLPVGTHRWDRFVTPDELAGHLIAAGFAPPACKGLLYNPFSDSWSLGADLDVNYLAAAAKPAAPLRSAPFYPT
jgi:2-polyprenyl-6-hydroxyphenyl methylase/3-demethylubiquinone-9 3-methyltransferase